MITYSLPRPTEEELNLGQKVEYFERIIDLEYHKKYKISKDELTNWIHHNYSSVFLFDEELNYNQFKKLIK